MFDNAPPKDLSALQDELSRLTTERAIVQAKVEIRQLTEVAEAPQLVDMEGNRPSPLMEDFGDFVDRRGYMYDDPSFGVGSFGAAGFGTAVSQIDDRADGRYRPVFENEQELRFIRGAAHVLTQFPSAINILENLTNYTIADGFKHEVQSENEELKKVAQGVLDTFFDDNDWASDLEREIHWRSREDGEAALVLKPYGWKTRASIVEPDQISEPASTRELEEFLQYAAQYGGGLGGSFSDDYADEFAPSWTYGVHSNSSDPSRALGYYVIHDSSGSDWQYYPANDVRLAKRIGSGVLELIKRNVPRNVKRGFSDFYSVFAHIQQHERLESNTEKGAANQAAISFIREHLDTTTNGQVSSMRQGSSTFNYQRPVPGGGTRTSYRQKLEPGTIIDAKGVKYQYGPMGQSGAPNFIAVIQSAIRHVGSRWCMAARAACDLGWHSK